MGLKENLFFPGTLAGWLLLTAPIAGSPGLPRVEAQASDGSSGVVSGAEAPILMVVVKSFSVENANMAEALLALRSSDVDHIVIGFEREPHVASEKGGPISLSMSNATLGDIVQRLPPTFGGWTQP